jgi:hypothetical protein
MTPALYGRSSRPLVSGLVCQSLEVGTWPGCCSLPAAKAAPEAPAEAAPLSVRRLRRTPAAEGTACGRWRPAVTETRARRKPRGRARWRARGGERAAASKRVAGAVKICISLVFFFLPFTHAHTYSHTVSHTSHTSVDHHTTLCSKVGKRTATCRATCRAMCIMTQLRNHRYLTVVKP